MSALFPHGLIILTSFFTFFLGFLVYGQNRKNKVNLSFSVFAWIVAFWGITLFFYERPIIFNSLIWLQITYLIVLGFVGSFFYFSFLFPFGKKIPAIALILYPLLTIPLSYFVLFSEQFIIDVLDKPEGPFAILGFIYIPYNIVLSFFTFWAYYNFLKGWLKNKGLLGTQYKYLFVSIVFFTIPIIITDAIIPIFSGNTRYFWVSPLFTVFFVALMVYAIVRYRFLDTRMVVKRSTIFSGVVIAVTASYALTAFLFSQIFAGNGSTFKSQIIMGLTVAVLVALGFRPLYEWLKKTTDAFLFKGEYRPEELMADITDVLSRTLEIGKIIQTLREKIKRALRVGEMEVVVLEENDSKQRTVPEGLSLYFKNQREALVLEELQRKYPDRIKSDQSFLLIKEMEELKAALIAPLFLKEKLNGLFLLSAKKSGDMFTNEDIKTLETIASQTAIAIENSRLYEKMKDFSKTLQKEVERQTKTLREANIKLEQLDKAKSEFVSIASHQLRTPLTVVKGYISMLLEGLWGETNLEQKRYLEMVYTSNERLIKLIEDLLTVSRIEAGRLELDWQMVSLENIALNVVQELTPLANKKGLYLRYEKPLKPLPKVKADPLQIRQVIMNLIDNAIHYTEKGGATVRIKSEKRKGKGKNEKDKETVIFSVSDTGLGISEEEKLTLFEKFSRGGGVSKLHPEGTGLGLYLTAKLVNAHGGRIWAESEGEGRGSVFCFEVEAETTKKN